jgi:hypothetical protein
MEKKTVLSGYATITFRYLVVGLAFASSGFLYSVLALNGLEHWSITLICFGLGFWFATFAWRKLDRQKERWKNGGNVWER